MTDAVVLLVAGPEVPDPDRWRARLDDLVPGGAAILVDSPAALPAALDAAAPAHPGATPVVVPLATTRHPGPIADCAKALRWARDREGVRACLTAPLGDATAVVSALRANMRRRPAPGAWTLVASAALDPFSDAELFRLARLAWQYGGSPVEVAFDGAEPSVAAGVGRCRALAGDPAADVRVLRADLALEPGDAAPLWSVPALAMLIGVRVREALHLLESHDDDGIDAALLADHDHGHAHSHGDEGGHGHAHAHGHHHGAHGHHHHGHHHHHDHHDGGAAGDGALTFTWKEGEHE
ncbi:sirohydrochlorin chelatase [Corynebacterium sp.]|uniref:sirohydrochlorin chelatase n=1 Tax=Corynebacterium sp. TaxID=1720 RepID=UPI0026DB1937|nr:hypothetical protein [Corynebacterium sp.]MDO4609216.1 hypothetical protein [Corynebacterium sp.]